MSELEEELKKAENSLKHLKHKVFEAKNIQEIADESVLQQMKNSEEEKEDIFNAVRKSVGYDVTKENIESTITNYLEEMQKNYEKIMKKNEKIEEEILYKKKELKTLRKKSVVVDQIAESKSYIHYCHKNLKRMKQLVEYTRDSIISDIKYMKKRTMRKFAHQDAELKDLSDQYIKAIEKKMKKKKLNTLVFPEVNQERIDEIVSIYSNLNEKSDKISSKIDSLIEKIKVLDLKKHEKLMKEFLINVLMHKKLTKTSDAFIETAKSEKFLVQNPYEKELKKSEEKVNKKAKMLQSHKDFLKSAGRNIDEQIAALEASLILD